MSPEILPAIQPSSAKLPCYKYHFDPNCTFIRQNHSVFTVVIFVYPSKQHINLILLRLLFKVNKLISQTFRTYTMREIYLVAT